MLKLLRQTLLDLLYPPAAECPLCGSPWKAGREAVICPKCLERIFSRIHKTGICFYCGRYFDLLQTQSARSFAMQADGIQKIVYCCDNCQNKRPSFIFARAVGVYEDLLREVIHLFKFQGKISLAEPLGRLMAKAVKDELDLLLKGHEQSFLEGQEGFNLEPLVVPVPLHPNRLAERGFNQAELLAEVIARELGLELDTGILLRKKDTSSQTLLSRKERLVNLRGVFVVSDSAGQKIQGRPILLIDDVLTSGATCEECTRVLRCAGSGSVGVVTAASGRITNGYFNH